MVVRSLVAAAFCLFFGLSAAHAATDAEKCEASRLKLAGKHAQCMLKAEATAILKTELPDYAKCTSKYDDKCASIATKYGAACPLPADCAAIKVIAECASDGLPIPTCDVDPDLDLDEDGFTGSGGDCADCDDQVNPGALELAANGKDDDCDGTTDNALASCDAGLALASTSAMEGANALGLCQTTNGMASNWGVLSATYVRANGAAAVPGFQTGLSDSFGTNVAPLEGSRLLVLSTGRARSATQPDACGGPSCPGLGAGAAPMGFPQNVPACPVSTAIHDDVALQVQLRVPTNVVGYRYRLNFYTFEYPDWVCTAYNDQFIALASPPPIGAFNGNITFSPSNVPVGVNYPLLSCAGCPNGTAELAGTGFDTYNPGPAAATSWLVSQAPATPGGIVTIRFAIYDVGDATFDATVLLDGFEWITSGPVNVATTVGP